MTVTASGAQTSMLEAESVLTVTVFATRADSTRPLGRGAVISTYIGGRWAGRVRVSRLGDCIDSKLPES